MTGYALLFVQWKSDVMWYKWQQTHAPSPTWPGYKVTQCGIVCFSDSEPSGQQQKPGSRRLHPCTHLWPALRWASDLPRRVYLLGESICHQEWRGGWVARASWCLPTLLFFPCLLSVLFLLLSPLSSLLHLSLSLSLFLIPPAPFLHLQFHSWKEN